MLLFVASFRKDERKLERLPLSFFGLFVSSINVHNRDFTPICLLFMYFSTCNVILDRTRVIVQ